MAVSTRRAFRGNPVSTTTTSTLSPGGLSVTIAATTGWYSGADPFYVVVSPGTASEEKLLVTISGSTLTISTRGADNTSDVLHNSGATIYPCATAVDFDEANKLASVLSVTADAVLTLPTGTDTLVGRATTDTLTNKSLSVGQVTGLGSGVAAWLADPTSAKLATALTDETGSGALNFGSSGAVVRTGGATMSADSSKTVTACFSATYAAYKVVLSDVTLSVAGETVTVQLGVAGTPATTNYVQYRIYNSGTVIGSTDVIWVILISNSAAGQGCEFKLINPFLAVATKISGSFCDLYAPRHCVYDGSHSTATSYDDLKIIVGSGTITGTVNVYGYKLS